ncbi:hypothetical protein Pst134EA_019648 [Puccinia striiformis f. sp. tritici]|uniref:C2H2-type domain-containing protein n=1 Tax=Puccinia striiformis f. sp. tritici PST-78 TaxID=1165861 RepID=A0A0L0W2B7_9BASI|nr:hypothetical protein Pst134EA_019648 [Puccinia striiformis f. sp. tritici]KAH9459494.1 hypothetical protein Pst134EA_019648 [Puccinia striiformis f. sp. tritici]KNF05410.1 hypothetical protein, variant [Puccinia striiformis f. sp. tritici PST-78]
MLMTRLIGTGSYLHFPPTGGLRFIFPLLPLISYQQDCVPHHHSPCKLPVSRFPSTTFIFGLGFANTEHHPFTRCALCFLPCLPADTLARPYSCTVCLKTFARQDTLNRHLRLHTRSDGKLAIGKPPPVQPSPAPASPSGGATEQPPPPPPPPRNLLGSPIRSNFDMLSVTGVSQPPFASTPYVHRRMARERGLSLSALEHSSLPGHLTRDRTMLHNAPRQSISLPLQQPQEQFAQPHHHLEHPFQYDQTHLPSSRLSLEIASQPSESSTSYLYEQPMEARRGSWCPSGQNWSDHTSLLPPEESGPPPSSTRAYRHQPHHLRLGVANWSKNLTNTFGLVEAGIGPVPLSAPPTCTDWGTALIGPDATENNNSTASLVGPRWETVPQYESQSQIHQGWSGLGRLEEEEQIKLEPDLSINSAGTSQLILSSPPQTGSFDQPNSTEANYPTGSSSTDHQIPHEFQAETNLTSTNWSFPPGTTFSYQQYPSQGPISAPHHQHQTSPVFSSSDPVDCFGNVWQTSPKNNHAGSFHPAYWNPTIYTDGQHEDTKPIVDSGVLNPNGLPTKNPWEEVVELDF